MKKVRYMLLAIAVIAVAGGTLAFKAKFENITVCTDEARLNPTELGQYTCLITEPGLQWIATCSNDLVINTLTADEGITLCYTFPEQDECPTNVTGTDCDLIVAESGR